MLGTVRVPLYMLEDPERRKPPVGLNVFLQHRFAGREDGARRQLCNALAGRGLVDAAVRGERGVAHRTLYSETKCEIGKDFSKTAYALKASISYT